MLPGQATDGGSTTYIFEIYGEPCWVRTSDLLIKSGRSGIFQLFSYHPRKSSKALRD